jgi:hypothetical protein
MSIGWSAVATIAAPVIALFVGIWVNRRFESRPRLISYYSHVSSFTYTPQNGSQVVIHTHAVVLRNTGRRSATNIRLTHLTLPDFNIWPTLQYRVETLPNDAKEIIIPILVPGEQITISYLYFPPLTFRQIHAGIKHDQGFAQQINVLLQRQYPQWFNNTVISLVLMGIISILCGLFILVKWLFRV